MKNLKVKSVDRVPYAEDEEPGMPAFRVRIDWKGQESVYEVAVEISGRDAEWTHEEGPDPKEQDFDAFLDEETAVFEAIYEHPGYQSEL